EVPSGGRFRGRSGGSHLDRGWSSSAPRSAGSLVQRGRACEDEALGLEARIVHSSRKAWSSKPAGNRFFFIGVGNRLIGLWAANPAHHSCRQAERWAVYLGLQLQLVDFF